MRPSVSPARTTPPSCPDSFRASSSARPARVGDHVDGRNESPAMTRWGRGRGEERLQPQINCEAGFAGIKWDKWDSTGQATPGPLCRGPMTLPSAHHGAIFAQAPRPVHRTLVRGSRASLKGLARGTTIPNARGSCARERSAAPPPSLPGPLRPQGRRGRKGWRRLRLPSALRVREDEQRPCRLRPPSALLRLRRRAKSVPPASPLRIRGRGTGGGGFGRPVSSSRHKPNAPRTRAS